jgi:preprotein translocase subunit Sec61beta
MWRLFYPFRYFWVRNPEKHKLDLWPTLVIAAVIAAPFCLSCASFFRPNGFLDKILVLTAPLTGFYVAALVAAATFPHPDLDRVITAGPVVLVSRGEDGKRAQEALTRREFVCILFGYLSFSSFIISVLSAYLIALSSVGASAASHWPAVGVVFSPPVWAYIRASAIIVMSLLVAHLVTATGLGVYYLMDRIYRHDRKITTPKPAPPSDTSAAA